ncbi:MAG: hypothetical protein WAM82_28710 [Thermoanaerobaculia bacterium]
MPFRALQPDLALGEVDGHHGGADLGQPPGRHLAAAHLHLGLRGLSPGRGGGQRGAHGEHCYDEQLRLL